MTFERDGEWFLWRVSCWYLRITWFKDSQPNKFYRGPGWWNLWFEHLNIDWDRS